MGVLPDQSVEEITGETYGPLKALCEQAVQAAFPGTSLVVRPGLIVGPHDASDRFTYWPWRVAQGGRMLAPGRPERRHPVHRRARPGGVDHPDWSRAARPAFSMPMANQVR